MPQVAGGPRNWGTGFMPAVYQGTRLDGGPEPIANLQTPAGVGPARQQGKLDFLGRLNRRHLLSRLDQSELDARIKSYELAFRMQAEAPEAVDLARETAATHALYGLDDPATERIGRLCLLARRLVERGVRFVQIYCGAGSKWDAHSDIESEPRQDLPRDGPAGRRPAQGPQAPRSAGRDAGRLGRRVRPHADVRERQRPRPQSLRLHHVDGRRRRQGGHRRRQDRRRRPSRHRRPAPRPRHPRHDPARSGRRSHQARSIGTRAGPNARPSTKARFSVACSRFDVTSRASRRSSW